MCLSSLIILIILRLANQPSEWIFATVTFLGNSLRIFKLITLIPWIGPYANTFYQILKRDVPLFLTLFTLFLLIFTGTYSISLRTPYTAEGFTNASLMQDTKRNNGTDNGIQWVFVSGVRVLLEGNVYGDNDDDVYVYKHLNWLAAILYLTYIFLTAVVFLNMFIAQLSATYAEAKENAERAYAWYRLNFIVQIKTSSLLSLCWDIKRKIIPNKKNTKETKEIHINKDDLFKYYGVHTIKDLNTKYFAEDVEVKAMLASIKNQKIFAQQTYEMLRSHQNKAQYVQSHDKGNEEIKELNKKIDTLMKMIEEKIK